MVQSQLTATDAEFVGQDSSDDEIVLGVLDAIERDPSVTRRSVARELGIALGLANAYLKRGIRKGLIKVSQVPRRRYAYYLTPQGFAEKSRLTATYLSDSFSFFRKARAQCGDLYVAAASRGQRNLALIGNGDLAEIASLVSREYPVKIAGVIASAVDVDRLKQEIAALGHVDAVVITALVGSREAFTAAIAAFGVERVHAPPLLRLTARSVMPEAGEAV